MLGFPKNEIAIVEFRQHASSLVESCMPLSSVVMLISYFGKPWIKGQFGSLFPEYDAYGPELDATEVFPGNREAVCLKMSGLYL